MQMLRTYSDCSIQTAPRPQRILEVPHQGGNWGRMMAEQYGDSVIKCRYLQESLLLELLALSFHHVQSREDHQVWLELFQAGHKHLQHIHGPVGEVVGEDESVGMGSL